MFECSHNCEKHIGFLEKSPDSKVVPRCALLKIYSENMQLIYRKISILKCAVLLKSHFDKCVPL